MNDCPDVANRDWAAGNEEYLEYEVTADVTLGTQGVSVTFDRETFLPAAWLGSPGTTRTLRTVEIVTDADLPEGAQSFEVFVRVEDVVEHPLHLAETITVI